MFHTQTEQLQAQVCTTWGSGPGLSQIIVNLKIILFRTDTIPKVQQKYRENLVMEEIWKSQPGQRPLLLETWKISKCRHKIALERKVMVPSHVQRSVLEMTISQF